MNFICLNDTNHFVFSWFSKCFIFQLLLGFSPFPLYWCHLFISLSLPHHHLFRPPSSSPAPLQFPTFFFNSLNKRLQLYFNLAWPLYPCISLTFSHRFSIQSHTKPKARLSLCWCFPPPSGDIRRQLVSDLFFLVQEKFLPPWSVFMSNYHFFFLKGLVWVIFRLGWYCRNHCKSLSYYPWHH